MVDSVATEVILDNRTTYMAKFTNISDATGEGATVKIDVDALTVPCHLVSIDEIIYSTFGAGVQILWDATTDVLVWMLPANSSGHLNFRQSGTPLVNTKATGYTGDVSFLFTSALVSAGHGYSIVLICTKTL